MTSEDVEKVFGFRPETIGLRHRGWWIIENPDEDDESVGAVKGDLCVKARDGASNPVDVDAFKQGECMGTVQDSFDYTYRYYYYKRPHGTS